LHTAGIIVGAFLILVGLLGLIKRSSPVVMQRFPRSRLRHWSAEHLSHLDSLATRHDQMGEFSGFRRPLLIALPIGYVLVLRFVDEFLAVRALGILCLLAAEPLLDAAFLRYESSRLLITVFAYLLIVAGLFWVSIPYVLRANQLDRTNVFRWRC